MTDIHLYPGNNAVAHLVNYCEAQHMKRFLLVADRNTFAALGQAVENAIKEHGWDMKSVVFEEQEVIPNEDFIFQVLLQADFRRSEPTSLLAPER